MTDSHEDWYADAWHITDGWVRDVELRDGLYGSSPLRGDNPVVANRRGVLWRPKTRDVGGFTLNIWLGDISRSLVEQWWDQFLRAVNPGHRLVTYRRTLANGSSRYCKGEVVQAVAPAPFGNNLIRCGLEVSIPDGVWWDYAGSKANNVAGAGVPLTLPLTNFAGVTTEQHDLLYVITGPVQNPKVYDITDGVDGNWFAYDYNLPAGQSLSVNASTWGVTGTGFAANLAKLRYSAGRYLIVPPAPPGGTPTVQLRGDSAGAGAGLTVSGVPAYAA